MLIKMPTLKDCNTCGKQIGVASKHCPHCNAKQPYKKNLEKRKEKISQEWKNRQKKNSSVKKVYDATNLLLHKWDLLERFPILLLARRTSNGFSAECFCPWNMDTEDTQDAFLTIKRLYESLLNVAIADKEASSTGESSAINSSQTETPPADPASESTPLLTCNVAIADKEASSTGDSSAINSSQTETPPADPASESTPLLSPESDTLLLPPASATLASLVSITTSLTSPTSLSIAHPVSPLTHPVSVSSQSSSPLSSSLSSPLPPTATLSTCSKLSTELGSPGPVSSSRKKRQIKRKVDHEATTLSTISELSTELGSPGPVSSIRKKRQIKRKADHEECPMHKESTSFPYKKILRKRIREGHAEVLVQWHPCSGCGKKWKNSWEPRENFQSSS